MSHQVEDCSEQKSKPVVSRAVVCWCCRVHDVNIARLKSEGSPIFETIDESGETL